MIRQAGSQDLSRIAEILVFSKRVNYRRIFRNDQYSFGELQVVSVAREYAADPRLLAQTWVFEEDFVKGLIRIRGKEVETLYTDPFFTGQGIGGKLLSFAIDRFDVGYLWALEKNEKALAFYGRHGFFPNGVWQYEEGTAERLLLLERKQGLEGSKKWIKRP